MGVMPESHDNSGQPPCCAQPSSSRIYRLGAIAAFGPVLSETSAEGACGRASLIYPSGKAFMKATSPDDDRRNRAPI